MKALALLAGFLGLLVAPDAAEVTLVEPVELNKRVAEVNATLADPDSSAAKLHFQAQRLFDQAQNTHHLPVTGIGNWQKAEYIVPPDQGRDQEPTTADMVSHLEGLLIQEPPLKLPSGNDPNTIRERLIEDYAAFAKLVEADAVQKDTQGQLPANAAAAYVWDVAKSAKDGAVQGMMLVQSYLYSPMLREFVLATVGAHEPRHRRMHETDAKGLADDVKKAEEEAFFDQGALMEWMDPTGQKFVHLWINTVEKPGTPQAILDYVKHLAEVRHAYNEGRGAIRDLVDKLGYQDKPGLFHAQQAGPAADGGK